MEDNGAVTAVLFDLNTKKTIPAESLPSCRFVGILENEIASSMACLLEDGTVLTTLHSIFDFDSKKYIDLSDATVTFVFKNHLYIYSIREIIHDGLKALGNNYHQFDYARLRLNGNPTVALTGGLKLDTRNHWGSAMNTEPAQTRAISGPLITRNNENDTIQIVQCTSLSENAAAQSGNYLFAQEGNHPAAPGFSGQAILDLKENVLYAMHSHLDKSSGKRIGIKISEYLKTQKLVATEKQENIGTPIDQRLLADLTLHIQREKLRRNGGDIDDIETFLDLLSTKKEIPEDKIPQSLKTDVVDSHQQQHVGGSGRDQKSYFYKYFGLSVDNPSILAFANCINKLVSEYYQHHLKTADAVNNQNLRRSSKFVVELDVNVGIDVKAGNKPTNLVTIDGFGGASYHVYPATPETLGRGTKPTYINARKIIAEAKERRANMQYSAGIQKIY